MIRTGPNIHECRQPLVILEHYSVMLKEQALEQADCMIQEPAAAYILTRTICSDGLSLCGSDI